MFFIIKAEDLHKLLEDQQKFEDDRKKQQMQDQKLILGKQGTRPKLSFSFK